MTVIDPFAAAPEEAQQTEAAPTPSTGTYIAGVNVIPRASAAAPSSGVEIVMTFKEGSGFDATWNVVHASTVEEADTLLDEKFAALLTKQKRVAEFFRGGPVAAARGGNTSGASAPPQGATEAPSWAPAKHQPDAVYKTGVSKAGKTWHAWMAPEKGGYDPKFFYQN